MTLVYRCELTDPRDGASAGSVSRWLAGSNTWLLENHPGAARNDSAQLQAYPIWFTGSI